MTLNDILQNAQGGKAVENLAMRYRPHIRAGRRPPLRR